MRIKICGITCAGDAEAALKAGADALGFVFSRTSPRFIQPEAAAKIIAALPPFVTPVGVFADADPGELAGMIARAGVRCLQMHGPTDTGVVAGLKIPLVKAFRVGPGFRLDDLAKYSVSAYLLDGYAEGIPGGTGKVFDWSIAVGAKKYGRVILAGGLNAENVGDAVRTVRPYAVDVSSGVESAPGRKDPEKLAAFCFAARAAGERFD